jgi:hypothetical protein
MTVYRLARTPGDYAAAQSMLKGEGFANETLMFPTILALDELNGYRVVGVLSTRIQDKMIIAGPLALQSERRRARTAIRLIDLYDIAMRGIGIISYIFHTEEGSIIDKSLAKMFPDMEPYAVENGQRFFVRRL